MSKQCGNEMPGQGLRSLLGYLKWRPPILEKSTVESPYCTIVWHI